MTTVVFVHGTGVRQPHFDATFARVTAEIANVDGSVPVLPCYWGEPHGARLSRDGASIPDGMRPRGTDDDSLDDGEVRRWALLEIDPLFELRLIAATGAGAREVAPHTVPPGRRIRQAALELPTSPQVREAAGRAGLAETFDPAVTTVLGAPVTADALAAGQQTELATALAAAIVAEAMTRADQQAGGPVPLIGQRRDALVELLVAQLHGDARAMMGRAVMAGAQLAATLGATRPAERRRLALTSAVSPAAGDIMVYLARGAAIREHITTTVAAVDDDVVLLAHSLGGIACVDVLVDAPPANVRGLITVGSQAPYLHELGALPSLPPAAPLPDTFPVPWINIFDRRDLLAFLAEPIFGERVRDVEVDNGVPFPRSHSAYFANPAVYAVLRHVMSAVRE
ncbi:hypothetical protein AB0M35_14600 [Micromonospora sp. NPDC051196]|uniref:hypothetical protein n=1 Tax=Micromonospora sp. NPDC051196 TaxID=3155281 RepID=UPI0034148CA8